MSPPQRHVSSIFLNPTPHRTSRYLIEHFLCNASEKLNHPTDPLCQR